MRFTRSFLLLGVALLTSSAQAQLQRGDLVAVGAHTLFGFRTDGTVVMQTQATYSFYGLAVASDGRIVVGATASPGTQIRVILYSPAGVELSSFPLTTAGSDLPRDIGILSDDTILIPFHGYSGTGRIVRYALDGTLLDSIGGLDVPQGMDVDERDDFRFLSRFGGHQHVIHMQLDGTVLSSVQVPNGVHDIHVAGPDRFWRQDIFDTGGGVLYGSLDVRDLVTGYDLGGIDFPGHYVPLSLGIDLDGNLWTTVQDFPTTRTWKYTPAGMLLVDAPFRANRIVVWDPSPGTTYCSPASSNSTGSPARIQAIGSRLVSDGDLTLYARDLPTGGFGYFLVGSGFGMLTPPGSQGTLCLCPSTGPCSGIGRFNHPMQILQGPFGSLAVDLAALPLSPPAAVAPGETWNFQCWYRDGPTSNFTDAVSVMFN